MKTQAIPVSLATSRQGFLSFALSCVTADCAAGGRSGGTVRIWGC